MGFDRIDRQFRRREIKLECADCSTTNDVEVRYDGENKTPLCKACYFSRECESWAGY